MNLITGQTASLVEEPPTVDLATATDFLRTRYGIVAELEALRSERDLNFLATADGRQFVVKVSNSGDDPAQIEMESAAMRHVAEVDPDLPIPRIVDAVDGARTVTLQAADGRVHQVRVMTVMPGAVGDLTALPEDFAADFGAVCARLTRAMQGFIHPATHYASSSTDPSQPPMGLRMRLKASYSCTAYSAEVQVICAALKKYGMFVADNGSDWYVSGDHDPRWNDDALGDLKRIPGSAFEAVYTGDILRTPPP